MQEIETYHKNGNISECSVENKIREAERQARQETLSIPYIMKVTDFKGIFTHFWKQKRSTDCKVLSRQLPTVYINLFFSCQAYRC